MRILRTAAAVILLTFALAGCDRIPFLKAPVKQTKSESAPPVGKVTVAKVGSYYITLDDLNKEIENYNGLVTAQGIGTKIETKAQKLAYLKEELVRKYVLYQEALDRRVLEKSESLQKALENAKISLLVTDLLREEIAKIDVSSQEIEKFYNDNKDSLKEPEQRKVREIMVPTEEEAKQVNIQLFQGGDFAALATQYSKAATAAKGGDVGWVSLELNPKKRIRFDKFYEVVFSQDAGSISSYFKGPEGFYIVKVEEIKKPEPKSLSELWDNIKSYLLLDKQQKAISALSAKIEGETKVEIYEGKVE